MIAIMVAAGALVGVLYNLPKVIVSDKNKTIKGATAAQLPADTASHLADNHTLPLSPEQASTINRLRNSYEAAESKEKKITFADSLAAAFTAASKPDSAAKYLETIATIAPTTVNLLRAANGYYDAFGFAVDMQKASGLGEK